MMVSVIDSFTAAAGYGFLSNFYEVSFWIDGKQYKSIEHAYQSHKTDDPTLREIIRNAKTSSEAKKLGQCIIVRQDWNDIKLQLMREFLRKKFDNPFLEPLLLRTGEALLINKNRSDKFWGVVGNVGENWLGRMLMDIRVELSSK
jgi:ribA/ribD-fused uncharacterized protein